MAPSLPAWGTVLPLTANFPSLTTLTELENAVKLVDPRRDALYSFSASAQASIRSTAAWKTDPHHFTNIRLSAVALLKMVMHARSGGSIEIMGLMVGKIETGTFVITDAFRLPVEGTETRVNAHAEASEYMAAFDQSSRDAGRPERVVGWYHSHPGYGCWLSGIDVMTQATWQRFEDPFVAVVVDPDRTISAGKVEIGAFRCFPDGYQGGEAKVGNAAVPTAKAADFGAHADKYYPLEVLHYKSSLDATILDALWNKYWAQTLGASPLVTNRDYGTRQMEDLAQKLGMVNGVWRNKGSVVGPMSRPVGEEALGKDPLMDKAVVAARKIAAEEKTGLLAAEVKEKVFGLKAGDEDVAMAMQDVK